MVFLKQRYFPNLFIALMVEQKQVLVSAKLVQNRVVKKSYEAAFENSETHTLNDKVLEYIKARQAGTLDSYIATFLNTKTQGIVPTASTQEFGRFGIDVNHVKHLPLNENASVYSSLLEVEKAREYFEECGLDLLYSPFALLHKMLLRDGFPAKPTLYIYNHTDSFTTVIYSGDRVLFGVHTSTIAEEQMLESGSFEMNDIDSFQEERGVENLVRLDDENEFQSLDDIGSLDDLDSSGEDFDEGVGGVSTQEEIIPTADSQGSIDIFGRSMQIYDSVILYINEFYANELYENAFVEEIIIYDNYKISKAISDMFEAELMMGVKYKQVNSLEMIMEMAMEDINL